MRHISLSKHSCFFLNPGYHITHNAVLSGATKDCKWLVSHMQQFSQKELVELSFNQTQTLKKVIRNDVLDSMTFITFHVIYLV